MRSAGRNQSRAFGDRHSPQWLTSSGSSGGLVGRVLRCLFGGPAVCCAKPKKVSVITLPTRNKDFAHRNFARPASLLRSLFVAQLGWHSTTRTSSCVFVGIPGIQSAHDLQIHSSCDTQEHSLRHRRLLNFAEAPTSEPEPHLTS